MLSTVQGSNIIDLEKAKGKEGYIGKTTANLYEDTEVVSFSLKYIEICSAGYNTQLNKGRRIDFIKRRRGEE